MPAVSIAVTAQHPKEDQNFTQPHTGTDFPVGWQDLQLGEFENQIELRLVYPAMASGEGKDMAGNGPFPYVQFFVDSGESSDSYMDFSSRLAKRGFIVAVHSDSFTSTDFDEVIEQTVLMHSQLGELNNSAGLIGGSFGQFDLQHWGLSGHGIGAAAAYGVFPFWMNSTLHNSSQPPRALFGLGVDFSDWNGKHWTDFKAESWVHAPASPGAGLFLTGTADEIYSSNEATTVLSQGGDFAWQMMEVLGADHYQFQDSTSFLEGLSDGDASLSQDEQNTIAADHVLPYLDLTLRGSHDAFREAFNRPVGPHVVSDSDAYLVENLESADFLLINQTSFVPHSNATFGPQITINSFTEWTLRDGRTLGELPSEWNLEVECRVLGMNTSTGSFDSNGTAHCVFPMQDVAPGIHTAQVKIFVEGASSTHRFDFFRTDAPIQTVDPTPRIEVLERGTTSVDASVFGSDPDGQDLFFMSAELIGNSSTDFSIDLSQDKRTMSVNHLAVDEVVNGTQVNLTLRAGGSGVIDEVEVTSEIIIILVDDPVQKIADVPMQNLIEDGSPITLSLSNYVMDPEGASLVASVVGANQDTYGPVSFSFSGDNMTLTPLLNANGASVLHLFVGDGTNAPIELDIPLYVEPVNDGILINETAWSFTVIEDEGLSLNLSDLASDVDGDNLFWTIESTSQSVEVTRSFSLFIVTPILDFSGFDNFTTINISDGSVTVQRTMNITVLPSPDAPILTLQELNLIDATAASLQWWVYDADGIMPNTTEIQVNGTVLENLSSSCVYGASDQTNRCLSMLPIPESHNGTIEVRVSVYDEELGLDVTSSLWINTTPFETVPLPPSSDSDGLSSLGVTLLTGTALLILIVLLSIILVLRRGVKNTPDLPIVEVEQVVEIEVEEEVTSSKPKKGGLLAQAQQKK